MLITRGPIRSCSSNKLSEILELSLQTFRWSQSVHFTMKPIIIIPATWQKFSYKKYHKSWPTKGLHILILPKIYLVKNIIRFHERYWEWINVALGLWKIGLGNIMNDLWKFTSYIIWTLPKLMETLDRSVYRFNSQPNKFIDLTKRWTIAVCPSLRAPGLKSSNKSTPCSTATTITWEKAQNTLTLSCSVPLSIELRSSNSILKNWRSNTIFRAHWRELLCWALQKDQAKSYR